MENFNKVMELVEVLQDQVEKYEAKPTKAESKRIRNSLNEIKKLVTPAKKELIEEDYKN